MKVDLSGLEYDMSDSDGWVDGSMVIGHLGIVKVIRPDGVARYQLLVTEDLVLPEKLGLAQMIQAWADAELDAQMFPDDS